MIEFTIKSIESKGNGSYRVSFVSLSQPDPCTFAMAVSKEDETELVECETDFYEFVGHATGPLRPLYEAVLAFHRAVNLVIPGSGRDDGRWRTKA